MANKVLDYSPIQRDPASTTETYKDISMKSVFTNVQQRRKLSVGKNVDVDAVKNSIRNIFTWTPGERILNPEFGNKVRNHLYEPITDFTSEQIVGEINHAVKTYEPRAEIDAIRRIDNTEDHERNTVGVNIIWHVVGLPTKKYSETILL